MALYDLGLTPEQFYDCTPRQLDALIKRHERAKQETEFLFAQLTSCVVNFSMSRPKEPVSPKDLMPSEWSKRASKENPQRKRKRQAIADELRANIETFMKKGPNG